MEEVVRRIFESKAIEIRENFEEPFVYSSGNRGPIYVMIKGLCGNPTIFNFLISRLVERLNTVCGNEIDFINGNATGGMICGWEIRNKLSMLQNRDIPYVYLRESRKIGGHNELITGIDHVKQGQRVLIVEELVNFAETTTNAIKIFRQHGYQCNYATCILSYDNKEASEKLKALNVTLVPLITMKELFDIASQCNLINNNLVTSVRDFIQNPITWQLNRNMVIPKNSALDAQKLNYHIVKLSSSDAVKLGAPSNKANTGFTYYKCEKINLYIALDCDDVIDTAMFLSKSKYPFGFKINLDCLFGNITDLIKALKLLNRPIFLDLKMANGIETMKKIIHQCIKMQIDIVNVYPHIGKEYLTILSDMVKGTNTKLFMLTVLTHYDDTYTEFIYNKSMEQVVLDFTNMAYECKMDGVIVPSTYLYVVKNIPIIKMCPGIRFAENGIEARFQNQINKPEDAAKNGADILVVGTAILKSSNQEEAIAKIVNCFN
jgi:orotidine 5'-phosphate decarboxylase subfamily 1